MRFKWSGLDSMIAVIVSFAALFTSCNNDSGIVRLNNSGNFAPSIPTNPTPRNDTTLIAGSSITLQWDCTDNDVGDTVRYDVFFDNNDPPVLAADSLLLKVYDIGILGPDTYFWKIVARDKIGATSNGPVWKFTVNPQ